MAIFLSQRRSNNRSIIVRIHRYPYPDIARSGYGTYVSVRVECSDHHERIVYSWTTTTCSSFFLAISLGQAAGMKRFNIYIYICFHILTQTLCTCYRARISTWVLTIVVCLVSCIYIYINMWYNMICTGLVCVLWYGQSHAVFLRDLFCDSLNPPCTPGWSKLPWKVWRGLAALSGGRAMGLCTRSFLTSTLERRLEQCWTMFWSDKNPWNE